MGAKDTFEFLNSPIWIKYTHQKYKTLDEMRYRTTNPGEPDGGWEETLKKVLTHRKTNAVPLFVKSLKKNFWFYPADCINQKADELEKKGSELYQKISSHASFKDEFLSKRSISIL